MDNRAGGVLDCSTDFASGTVVHTGCIGEALGCSDAGAGDTVVHAGSAGEVILCGIGCVGGIAHGGCTITQPGCGVDITSGVKPHGGCTGTAPGCTVDTIVHFGCVADAMGGVIDGTGGTMLHAGCIEACDGGRLGTDMVSEEGMVPWLCCVVGHFCEMDCCGMVLRGNRGIGALEAEESGLVLVAMSEESVQCWLWSCG
jgi:hypothetical protein